MSHTVVTSTTTTTTSSSDGGYCNNAYVRSFQGLLKIGQVVRWFYITYIKLYYEVNVGECVQRHNYGKYIEQVTEGFTLQCCIDLLTDLSTELSTRYFDNLFRSTVV